MFNPFKRQVDDNDVIRQKLERVETRFEKVAQTATDAILIIDHNSTILFCNKAASETFGYRENEMIGREVTMIMPEEYRPMHRKGIRRYLTTGESRIIGKTIEVQGIRKNGEIFPLELSLSGWQEDSKYFFTGIIRDISERHKLFREMKLLQEISAGISRSDNFIQALRVMVEKICREGSWAVGEVWLEEEPGMISYAPIWYTADEKYMPFIEESRKSKFSIGQGMPGRVYGGAVEWNMDVSAEGSGFSRREIAANVGLKAALGVPVFNHAGKAVAGLMFYLPEVRKADMVFTSILTSLANQLGTYLEKKQAEQEVRASRDFYLTIFEDFPALIWRANTSGKRDYFNKTWLDFTGRPLEAELGDGWAENIHPEDLERCFSIYLSSFRKRSPFEMDYRMRRYDGEYRWIKDFGRPYYDHNKEFQGYIGACYDVTDQKEKAEELMKAYEDLKETNEELLRTEELLKELNAQLELKVEKRTKELKERNEKLLRINKDLDNFIYTASHDLKAPISNLEGLVHAAKDILEDKDTDRESLLGIIKMMDASVTRFGRTISDLTEITKVQKLKQEDVSLQSLLEIIQGILSDLQPQIKEADADLKLDVASCPPIRFSLKNLRSIVYNLLSNAIKYRSSERKLKISVFCRQETHFAVLAVQDNGLGIDLQKAKLFTMFKRFHDHVEGTGIGLYIIKRIIEDAGGKITVESQQGVGTTFFVHFPLKKR